MSKKSKRVCFLFLPQRPLSPDAPTYLSEEEQNVCKFRSVAGAHEPSKVLGVERCRSTTLSLVAPFLDKTGGFKL